MKTHTIRWNGDKTSRIIKFSNKFIKKMLKSHPYACSVLLDKLKHSLQDITGRRHTLDYDQFNDTPISKHLIYNMKCSGYIIKLNRWLYNGVRLLDDDLEIILEILDLYYKQMETIKDDNMVKR